MCSIYLVYKVRVDKGLFADCPFYFRLALPGMICCVQQAAAKCHSAISCKLVLVGIAASAAQGNVIHARHAQAIMIYTDHIPACCTECMQTSYLNTPMAIPQQVH